MRTGARHARGTGLAVLMALVTVSAAPVLALAPALAPPTGDEIRLAAIVSAGVPRGLVTVVVPIPAELRDEPEVSFEVRIAGGVEVLGRLGGQVRVAGSPARPLVLTLRVPANADAGVIPAADVIFRAGTGREYRVPLLLRVTIVRSLTVLGAHEMRGLRSGDRLELPFRIVNGGNAPDSVRISVQGPVGWITRLDRPAAAIVAARGQLEFTVSIGIPSVANVGDHTLAVTIRHAGSATPIATAFTTLGITGRAGEVAGLVLRPSIAAAVSNQGNATFTGIEVAGPVAHQVSLRAQMNPGYAGSGVTAQALSSVGASPAPFSASLSGPNWDVNVGNTAMQLSDLTGVNLIGRGVTAHLERNDRELRAIGARPSVGSGAQGELIGAGYWQRTDYGRFGASASYLVERGGLMSGRELRAFAADYRSRPIGTFTLGGALAHRTSGATTGLGYGGTIAHERTADRAVLRVTHSPGGSAAYARAVDEWQFEGSRTLSARWLLDAAAQHSRDEGSVFSGMRVTNWSVGQRFAYDANTALSLRGQSSSFLARSGSSDLGEFGSSERDLVAGVEWRRELLALTAEASVGQVTRSTELLGGRVSETTALQRGMRLTATHGFERWGTVDANTALEEASAGVGIPRQVWSAGLRWNEIPLAVGTRQARLGVESSLQRLGDLRSVVVLRATMRAALPAGLDLVISGERNPFFRDARGRAGWLAAMRLTASTRVFSPKALGPEGLVYEDRDLDGVRDESEPGVAGVVVRRGDAKATTDRSGRYRLPLSARGQSRIDQASLPIGLLAHPRRAADALERLDLPLLPTGSLTIALRLTPGEDGRVPVADLRPAVVILRDASGFEWIGRRVSETEATFEGIPTGSYTLEVNFALVSEPLRVEPGQTVRIVAYESSVIAVRVLGRAVRLFTPPSRSRTGPTPEGLRP